MGTREPDVAPPGNGRPEGGPKPSLGPTNPATLVVAALVTAALAWMFISRGSIPPDINWLPGITLAALSVAEGIAARNTKARIDRKPGTIRVNPLLVARFVVLAKASSLVGAIFSGAYGAVAVWALTERGRLLVAERNLGPAVAGFAGALALAAAALWLERSCRVPPSPDDEEDPSR